MSGNQSRLRVALVAIALSDLPLSCARSVSAPPDSQENFEEQAFETWTFVSMPDFLNVDTTYPQPGWEETLDFVLDAVKAEDPDFVLVPGDLVMGRWWSEEKIEEDAATYYAAWIERMRAHGLDFDVSVGDHEIGDNPWPADRARLVPSFKRVFRDYMKMPLNGPAQMKGTAYYFEHKNTLFVSVDVFEKGRAGEARQISYRLDVEL